tara:strand:- start:2253 stop:3356 length:1104 start_codon:yes stop_codon:yes gene_type:complete
MSKKRVIVAMSGGVDSSVAALLLKNQGYEVIGVTMRLWSVERDDVPPDSKRCCSVEDVEDARRVCQTIGAPHYFMNFEREFQEHVVDYFVRSYDQGRTPHPCLACNDKIKFDFLLRRALFLDADYIATGHYARVAHNGHRYQLLKGIDQTKDQSYVLFTLSQTELEKLLLPVGEYQKSDIRKLALDAGLPVANKPDSQEICFIPSGDYKQFIGERLTAKPGEIVDIEGNVVGTHPGIQFFTVGQRRGLGLKTNMNHANYVVEIDSESNQVTIGSEENLMQSTLWASSVNFTIGSPIQNSMEIEAKIRYKATESPATISPDGDWFRIDFHKPQRAITPGQPVVFYDKDELIGGGIIEVKSPVLTKVTV